MITNKEWLNSIIKKAKPYHRQDNTLAQLEQFLDQGYTHLTWITHTPNCDRCKAAARNYRDVEIRSFINNLAHNAPMADHAHPDDENCYLLVYVKDPELKENLPDLNLYYDGNWEEA